VENLDYPEQHAWAALAGARVNTQGWRRARAMLQNDRTKELRRRFLLTCVQRNRNAQLRLKALGEIADLTDADAFDDAIDIVGTWSREDKRAGTKSLLQALIDKKIGRRDQAQAWVWRLAGYTRELHEEYAVQRWPETKRLLGLLVNSSGRAHGRNARRLVHAARKQDRRLAVALLAAAVSHTPEGEEVLRGARMRMARKPSAVARELLRNFPKGGKRRKRKRNRNRGENGENGSAPEVEGNEVDLIEGGGEVDLDEGSSNGGAPEGDGEAKPKRKRSRRRKAKAAATEDGDAPEASSNGSDAKLGDDAPEATSSGDATPSAEDEAPKKPTKRKAAKSKAAKAKTAKPKKAKAADGEDGKPKAAPKRKRKAKPKATNGAAPDSEGGQMNFAGTEGDPVPVGESDE
jgi:ribonuclease E